MERRIVPRRSLEGLAVQRVRQLWRQPDITDRAGEAAVAELARVGVWARLRPGDEVAVVAGSRGIAVMPAVLRAVIEALRARGARPFVIPAMGSHGGGTAEGQVRLLASLGIEERTVGAPIRASMEVVELGRTADDLPVYQDAHAARAAGVILLNRIKKHTNYDGPVESGLCKMAVIGMGKHTQAEAVHQRGNGAMAQNIMRAAEVVFARGNVWAGIALLENARGGTAEAVGLAADEILAQEPLLLQRAKEYSAKIPFAQVDIGVVEWMGKEISGTGMDCYVIGRKRIVGEAEWPETPRISTLVVLDLTAASHGNGVGVGLADMTTARLVAKIDWDVTRANILTSGNLERGKVPLVFSTDREALEAAAYRERARPLEALRLLCLRDTLHLEELLVSPALAREAAKRDDLELVGEPEALPLDARGLWVSPWRRAADAGGDARPS